jgi:hypothetical protein
MKYRHTTHLHGDYLDGDLTPDQKELVEGHLADCPDCRHDLAQLRKLTQAAKMVDIPDPADGYFDSLTETIMARTDGIVVEAPGAESQDQMTPSAGINMFPGLPSPADPEDITDSAGTTGQ